jgi:hypothetical protein
MTVGSSATYLFIHLFVIVLAADQGTAPCSPVFGLDKMCCPSLNHWIIKRDRRVNFCTNPQYTNIKPMKGLANQPIQLSRHLHRHHLSLLPHIYNLTYVARHYINQLQSPNKLCLLYIYRHLNSGIASANHTNIPLLSTSLSLYKYYNTKFGTSQILLQYSSNINTNCQT